jgi:hypothetical protein
VRRELGGYRSRCSGGNEELKSSRRPCAPVARFSSAVQRCHGALDMLREPPGRRPRAGTRRPDGHRRPCPRMGVCGNRTSPLSFPRRRGPSRCPLRRRHDPDETGHQAVALGVIVSSSTNRERDARTVGHRPGQRHQVGDLDRGELAQALHVTRDRDGDDLAGATVADLEEMHLVDGDALASVFCCLVSKSMLGSARPAETKLTALVSTGKRMIAPSKVGRNALPTYRWPIHDPESDKAQFRPPEIQSLRNRK